MNDAAESCGGSDLPRLDLRRNESAKAHAQALALPLGSQGARGATGVASVLISDNMPHVFEVADRVHTQQTRERER